MRHGTCPKILFLTSDKKSKRSSNLERQDIIKRMNYQASSTESSALSRLQYVNFLLQKTLILKNKKLDA